MSYLDKIQPNKILVGDILHVLSRGMIFANQEVTSIEPESDYIGTKATDDGKTEGFGYTGDYWMFFLVERPKKPLPTKIGSTVEVADVQLTWVLCDPDSSHQWRCVEDGAWASNAVLQQTDWSIVE